MTRGRWIGTALFLGVAGTVGFACSSSESGSQFTSTPGDGGSGGGSGGSTPDGSVAGSGGSGASTGGYLGDANPLGDGQQFDPDAYWADDPPPQQCLDSGMTYPTPGGTPECPDDKNREGCPCTTAGEKAACWPGFRKNRNRGICHDGETTCLANGEAQRVWGPCVGYQLPTGDTGPEACTCFSAGQWKVDNLSPCFVDSGGGPGSGGAVSTILSGTTAQCPPISGLPIPKPSQPWSTNSLKVDCAGHFTLCYTLKAGDVKNPSPSDCILASVCTEGDYPVANQVTPFPPLDSWVTTTAAETQCAVQFATSGGYGEMTVQGLSVECDEIDNGSDGPKVFNRVGYCPLSCAQNPSAPECVNCQTGGSGSF